MNSPASPWEFTNLSDHLFATIGHNFGPDPVTKIDLIREHRRSVACDIFGKLRMNRDSVGMDLGSGPGYMAAEIAPRIRHLHCVDVSGSFLDLARAECVGLKNISFHQIWRGNLPELASDSLDFIYSHAVFIHLPLSEIEAYFAASARMLKPGGLMNFGLIYSQKRVSEAEFCEDDPHALRANALRPVLRSAWKQGFRPFYIWYGPNATAELILRKGGYSPFGTLSTYLRQTRLFQRRKKLSRFKY